MNRQLWYLVVGMAVAFSVTMPLAADISEDLGMDWKPESTWRKAKKGHIATYIRKAEALEAEGKYKKASRYYAKIEESSINLRNRSKAALAQGVCYQRAGKLWAAYAQYQRAVDEYSNYIPFLKVLELEFEIANEFYGGKMDKFLFMEFDTFDKAIEIYDHIAASAPYAPFTPEAIYRSGILSRKQGYYEDAIDKFEDLIRRYPRHDRMKHARLDLARTLLIFAAEADGDGALARRARRELGMLVRIAPDFERIDEAKGLLKSTMEVEAARLLYLGEFYQRAAHERLDASQRYLEEVVTRHSEAEVADAADILLSAIEREEDERAASGVMDEPEVIEDIPRRAAPKAIPAPVAPAPVVESTPAVEPTPAPAPVAPKKEKKKRAAANGKWLIPIENLDTGEQK